MNQWIARLIMAVGLAYPILVYVSLDTLPFAFLGVILVVLAFVRLVLIGRVPGDPLLIAGGAVAMAAAGGYTLLSRDGGGLRFYPVLMSLAMLALFAWSLRQPRSIIERLARMVYADFPDEAVAYARRLTLVWCGFFALNGVIALWTAVAADWAVWTLYNGLISYLLMGALFLGEYVFRQYRIGAIP